MPGVDALCSQICATFFTLAVREWIAQVNTEKNILSLLLHPRLGAVIQQMLEMRDTHGPSNRWPASPTCPGQVLPSFSVMFRNHAAGCINKVASTNSGPDVFPGNAPVVVIAESVGYASESSFHKAFVREFGCTPGEYRERVRQLAP